MGPTQDLNKFSFYLNGDGGGTILKKIHGEFPCVCVFVSDFWHLNQPVTGMSFLSSFFRDLLKDLVA